MIRVLLYTDEPVLAKGLEMELAPSTGFRLVSVCTSTSALVHEARMYNPDLLLLDLTPDLSFGVLLDAQRQLSGTRIVLWVRTISTELAYQAIEHGVRGILKRTHPAEVLVKCLQMVADGGLWFEETLKASFNSMRTISLTRRESQLVSLLSQGLKNKEIAATLFISEGTVKVYLSRLFQKLGVKDRFELALFGLKNMPGGEALVEMPPQRVPLPERREAGQSQWLRSIVMERPRARARVAGGGID
ncbi:MAG: response regulator transcription factor [Bryobacterales bacterium]|nr:response regulator transcription factor [Bryobacterales bacterium]